MADFLDEALAQALRADPYARVGSAISSFQPQYQDSSKYENANRNNMIQMLVSGLGGAMSNYGQAQAVEQAPKSIDILYQALQNPSADTSAILEQDPTGFAKSKIADFQLQSALKTLMGTNVQMANKDELAAVSQYLGIDPTKSYSTKMLSTIAGLEKSKQGAQRAEDYSNVMDRFAASRENSEDRSDEKFKLEKEYGFKPHILGGEEFIPRYMLKGSEISALTEAKYGLNELTENALRFKILIDANGGKVPTEGEAGVKARTYAGNMFNGKRKITRSGATLTGAEQEKMTGDIPKQWFSSDSYDKAVDLLLNRSDSNVVSAMLDNLGLYKTSIAQTFNLMPSNDTEQNLANALTDSNVSPKMLASGAAVIDDPELMEPATVNLGNGKEISIKVPKGLSPAEKKAFIAAKLKPMLGR